MLKQYLDVEYEFIIKKALHSILTNVLVKVLMFFVLSRG